jgi:hypothetical protein
VPVTQEETREIEGEFMLTGGHVSQWYESWAKEREKRSPRREREHRKKLGPNSWRSSLGAARAGCLDHAPLSGKPQERTRSATHARETDAPFRYKRYSLPSSLGQRRG